MNHQQQARKAFETELKGIGRRMEVGFALAGRRFEVQDWGLINFHATETLAMREMEGSSDARILAVIPAEVQFAANGNVRLWNCLGEPVAQRRDPPSQQEALPLS
ncbi:hypothetical protein ACUXAV_006458 [Cupriavidus metallidurans]|jgi:hypothetical protein|uniref:Uncharacterized protein n=1 Tax=Cupriavidus pauculus TaxID=82633 RepID=A0A3G8GW22_9BURK|nr:MULTISPECIES: hypothetical protein [Cupriavidus]AZG12155.1 hypothetical protein EHF44_01415 [Cupriavidus pauculus]MCA3185464.1 hypothetical protein [Cupriavidus sp.]MCA3194196.1 hypothetical protein [Cupriavidus sp.]MCA3232472.1 hypothetical protein [Cupriavidus sp.]MDE4922539.1 hypothetical protein [Cupriavidus metallidurans]